VQGGTWGSVEAEAVKVKQGRRGAWPTPTSLQRGRIFWGGLNEGVRDQAIIEISSGASRSLCSSPRLVGVVVN
jgi:hypothetical protein